MEPVIPLPDELRGFWDALSPPQQVGAQLVTLLNAAADPTFKKRYRRRWWGMLEERVRLGAMTTDTLPSWSSTVSSRLGGGVGANRGARQAWARLMSPEGRPSDSEVLEALDADAPVLLAFCRAYQDARRTAWEEAQEVAEEDEEEVEA